VIQSFLDYIQYEKRYSKHTVTAYKTDLEEFFIYLDTTYKIVNPSEATHLIIRSWIVNLMEKSIEARSVNRKISTLKSYYKFLLREGSLTQNPMTRVVSPKTSKKLPVFVEKEKMDFLFDHVDFGKGFPAIRNKLILEMFYCTGIRLSELVSLKTTDIDLKNCSVKVLGKRNKERIIPFTLPFKQLVEDYLKMKQKENFNAQDESFFVTDEGRKIYQQFVYRTVKKYLSQITTLDKKSPHVLRHTFATHMLNNGADINAIKELLGHGNLSATQVYTHNTVEKLKRIYKQAHPRA
jgi:integrase/recombinase XerC